MIIAETSHQTPDAYTRVIISSLLAGKDVGGIDFNRCGGWSAAVEAIHAAYKEGGPPAAKERFSDLTRDEPDLAVLMAGNSGTESRLVIHQLPEAFSVSATENFLIEDLIVIPSLNVLVGDGGVFKTILMLAACICIAVGFPFLGHHTQPLATLYLDEELGFSRLSRRLVHLMNVYRFPRDLPVYYACMTGLNLLQQEDCDILETHIRELKIGFVVIDAFADFMLGADENSATDVARFCHNLKCVADRTNAAIMLVHHANREKKYRGSSALKAAVDLMLMVEREADSDIVTFSCEKTRDIKPNKFVATVTFAEDRIHVGGVAPLRTDGRPYLTEAEKSVLEFLRQKGQATMKEIKAHNPKFTPALSHKAFYSLKAKKMVVRLDEGKRSQKGVYGPVNS